MSVHEILMFIIAFASMIIMGWFLKKTRLGMCMRAVSQDMVGAKMVGISINKIFGHTFALSSSLVGIAAILLSPKYFITPRGGWEILIKGFVVVAFGGMGSVRGSLYAAFILGLLESFVAWRAGALWILIFWFASFMSILIIRPRGLLGTSE